jgi:predicted ATP-dependent protease
MGLNGEQGIMIPSSNIQNLMLKEDVIEAVRQNKFKIWAIDTIDDGMEVLTGLHSGSLEEEGSIKWLINKTLMEYSETLKEFTLEEDEEEETNTNQQWVSDVVMK